jgi:hypothetical protein
MFAKQLYTFRHRYSVNVGHYCLTDAEYSVRNNYKYISSQHTFFHIPTQGLIVHSVSCDVKNRTIFSTASSAAP